MTATRMLIEFRAPEGMEFRGLDFNVESGNCRVYLRNAAGFAVGDGLDWQDAADTAAEKLRQKASELPYRTDIIKKSERRGMSVPTKLFSKRRAAPMETKEEDDLLASIGASLKKT